MSYGLVSPYGVMRIVARRAGHLPARCLTLPETGRLAQTIPGVIDFESFRSTLGLEMQNVVGQRLPGLVGEHAPAVSPK